MVSYWSLSDSKSSQVFRILFSILADLSNVIVWMISTRPLMSMSCRPFINLSVTVTRASTCINVIFMFYRFFQFPSKVEVFIVIFTDSILLFGHPGQLIPQICNIFFFVCLLLSGLVVCSGLGDLFACQNPIGVWASHSPGQILFGWSNFHFFHNSKRITLPIQLCLLLYSFWANMLYSLII